MKRKAKTFYPKYVESNLDLKCAVKTREIVIISSNKELFSELESKFQKKKASTNAKKTGSVMSKLGLGLFAISMFIPGLNGVVLMGELAVAGIGSLSKAVGSAMDEFEDYTMVIDYENKRVLFIKVNGTPCFNEKIDIIAGVDLKKILLTNNQ